MHSTMAPHNDFDNDNSALNPDGTFKDASEIIFFHSPSDTHPIQPAHTESPPPSPSPASTRPVRNSDRSKLYSAIATLTATDNPKRKKTLHDVDDTSAGTKRVKQQVIPAPVESDAPGKGKESITPTPSEDSGQTHQGPTLSEETHVSTSSSIVLDSDTDDDSEPKASSTDMGKRLGRLDSRADVLTFCDAVTIEGKPGYFCTICE